MDNEKLQAVKVFMIMTLLISASTLLCSNSAATTAKADIPSDLLQYEWRQAAQDASRSSFNPGPGPTTPHVEWRTEIPNVASDPVAFNGKLFVQAVGSTYCLDAFTGEILYKLTGVSGSIAKLDDTYMLIGNNCYKIADGSLVWKGPPGFVHSQSAFSGLGVDLENKVVYSGSQCWSVALPSQQPILVWDRAKEPDYGKYGSEISAVIYGSGVVVYRTAFNYLIGVNATTGKTLWVTATSITDWVYGASAIDGVLGRGCADGNFYGYNITTGKLMWVYNPGTFYNTWASASGAAYGMFYMKNQDTYLYAINTTTGKLVWRAKGPGVGYSNTLSIAGGKVYVQMGENQYRDPATGEYAYSEFSCFDAYTGELVWSLPVENGAPFNYQCVAYGRLYIVPTISSAVPGVWTYSSLGFGSIGEVWCISDTPSDWPMFLCDSKNSGYGEGPTNLALKWKINIGSSIDTSPTIVNGVVYIGTYDGFIYAFDADAGKQIWNYSTGILGRRSALTVVNGKVYTGADDGNIYCLDGRTGTKLWQASAGEVSTTETRLITILRPIGSPTVVDGRVYVAAGDTNLYCFNADTGAKIWNYTTGGSISSQTPAVADGAVYIGASIRDGAGPNVIKLNAITGEVIWNVDLPGFIGGYSDPYDICASVTVGGGMVFARATYRYNYALNATTGEIIWMVDARYNPGTPFQVQGNSQPTAMLYKYGVVYFPDYYGVTAVNARDGSEIWHTYLTRENFGPGLSYSYGRIYTVNEMGAIYVLDALSGKKLSYYQLGPATLHSVPTPYNGSLYVASLDWNLYRFDEAKAPTLVTTKLRLSLSTERITKGDDFYIIGSVSNVNTAVPVTVTLDKPDSTYVDIPVMTDENGNFQINYVPDMVGAWTIVAWWNGDAAHTAASSEKITLTVTEPEASPAPATKPDIDQAVNAALANLTPLIIAIIALVTVALCTGVYTILVLRKLKK
ncbi:MAG: PQQ-binding-like beta-propeller repeat protein [Candidatus Bathyarchaeia archaeon]